ncbi:MAG TPA: hypothetical protein VGT44_04700 [Ktedonobacteraceae bacterium]|nr:hypothetical protein [Ktedonobacteraceae bacterium]
MSETFHELYASLLKDVFSHYARQQMEQGMDGLASARTYAEQGKPDFALAFLLLIDIPDEEKRALLARAYEQRARHSDEKAAQLQTQFHRSFPMITLDAQKDRAGAQAIRAGARVAGANDTGDEVGKGDHNEQSGEV